MRNVVKVRLYPTPEQKFSLSKAFGTCRYIWNYCLAENNRIYKGEHPISADRLDGKLPIEISTT